MPVAGYRRKCSAKPKEPPVELRSLHLDSGKLKAHVRASHQTGWTALVAHLICLRGDREG